MDALLAKPVERLSPFFTAKTILHCIDIEEHLDGPACEALRSMAKFVSIRLAKGDRELGRSGAICPFAKQGSQTGGIRFSHCDVELGEVTKLNGVMDELRDLFLKRQELIADERESLLQAFVIVFSRLSHGAGSKMIEEVQQRLKTSYVLNGLMIGEFYPGCGAAGLYNHDFRPLDAPVVSLAVRRMTISDAPFMLDNELHATAFIDRYGGEGQARIDSAAIRRAQIKKATAGFSDHL